VHSWPWEPYGLSGSVGAPYTQTIRIIKNKIYNDKIKHQDQIHAGSNDVAPHAPAFDWVDKGYQFGGWDLGTE
jgi:hypothetical protein